MPATPSSPAFNGRRLRLARVYHGMTQSDLADRLEITQTWIGHAEAGSKEPSKERLESIAETLKFRPSFFFGPLLNEFTDDECHFRRKKTSTATAKHVALATGTLFSSVVDYLETLVDFPADNVPQRRATSIDEIERAAEWCRMQWGLTLDRPIMSMTRSVENAGVLVTRCASADKVDAFSRGTAGRKIIIVNEAKGATRTRFDIAHELGHLVLHVGMATGDDDTENQANVFASAFLMPRAAFCREFPRMDRLDWQIMFGIKRRWGTSLSAIVRRARDLGLITALQYTSAYKYISWNGWNKNEPDEPPLEQPEAVRSALEVLESDGESVADIAERVHMDVGVFLDVMGNVYQVKPRPPAPTQDTGPGGRVLRFDAARRRRAA